MGIIIKNPEQQIDFAYSLVEIREKYLVDALKATVSEIDVQIIDSELHHYVSKNGLKTMASVGLRGEILFAVPAILKKNPKLLGYYRLLLGYSQKEFYQANTGIGMFKSMEEKGTMNIEQAKHIEELCDTLISAADFLIDKLTKDMISTSFFDQLTLLTLGPQLRGSANVKRGTVSILQVFDIIYNIVKNSIVRKTYNEFELLNSSGRKVLIKFSSDPDIIIMEELQPDKYKYLIATEVKGGQDYSNIHNRIGEAEKSHQKAKKDGFVEFWTVVNVDNINLNMAHDESPTTNRFYRLSELLNENSDEYKDFKIRIVSAAGIK